MKRTASLSLIALACATTFAITQVEAQESQASASAGQLDKFVGSGTCTGNVMAMGKNPGHATTGKYTGEKVLDGNWVVIHYDEDQNAVNPKPFHVIQYFGYDTAKKRYVSVLVDNAEASYSTGTSPVGKATASPSTNPCPVAPFRSATRSPTTVLACPATWERCATTTASGSIPTRKTARVPDDPHPATRPPCRVVSANGEHS